MSRQIRFFGMKIDEKNNDEFSANEGKFNIADFHLI